LPRRFAPRNDRGGCAAGCAKQSQFAGDGDAPRRRRGRGDECKAIGKKGLGLMLCDSVVNRGRGEIGKLGGRRRAVLRRGISNKANLARPKPGNPKHEARNSKQARKRNDPNAEQSPFRPAGAPNEPNFRFFRPETRVARKNKANLRRSEGRDWGFRDCALGSETGDSRGLAGCGAAMSNKADVKMGNPGAGAVAIGDLGLRIGDWRLAIRGARGMRCRYVKRSQFAISRLPRRFAPRNDRGGGAGYCGIECQTKPIWRWRRRAGPPLGRESWKSGGKIV